MAFGREAIDANGPTRDFPDASMLTGLIANALGWKRHEAARHQKLQDRLILATRIERNGHDLRDFQTATLSKRDEGWTTRGVPEGRAGGENTYKSPHIRYRHYRADAALLVALRLSGVDEPPTLEDIAAAIAEPVRPLFIGRKSCPPSAPLSLGIVTADSIVAALQSTQAVGTDERERYILSPDDAASIDASAVVAHETLRLTGRRDWVAGVHAGQEKRIIVTFKRDAP